jgi:hypothetical protein
MDRYSNMLIVCTTSESAGVSWREDITYFLKLANGNREIRKTAGDPI